METVREIGPRLGIAPTCSALGLQLATYYRHTRPAKPRAPRPMPKQALSPVERETVLATLHEDRFVDLAPTEIYAQLLDEGQHLCSIRTMYRLLAENWLVAEKESAALAKRLIAESCARQNIEPGQLIIHADRGSAMRSKTLAQTMASLGVTKSHSRPHVSDDNPFSEAQFKTLKYRPDFPMRFDSLMHSQMHGQDFFPWYNEEHHHVALGLMTPHNSTTAWRRRTETAALRRSPQVILIGGRRRGSSPSGNETAMLRGWRGTRVMAATFDFYSGSYSSGIVVAPSTVS